MPPSTGSRCWGSSSSSCSRGAAPAARDLELLGIRLERLVVVRVVLVRVLPHARARLTGLEGLHELVAAKNKMDLAVNIAIGSSAQIALFVAPVLVLLSFVFGDHPMALVFNGYELAGMLLAVLLANFLTQEGESNWFEGVQLLAVYLVLGLVFLFA